MYPFCDSHTLGLDQKISQIKQFFVNSPSIEAMYQKIIDLGRLQNSYPEECKISKYSVKGCQSILYLYSSLKEGKLFFSTFSEALITSGLAVLITTPYQGENPETLFKYPPAFIDELGIRASLTPGRSNGLSSMYLRMQQDIARLLSYT